jgi:hypothetical protein
MSLLMHDLRYAQRTLRRHPGPGAVAILTPGIGIGGATAAFSVVDVVLLRPLPFQDPDRLVRVGELTQDGDRCPFSDPNWLDPCALSRTLASIAASGAVKRKIRRYGGRQTDLDKSRALTFKTAHNSHRR